MKCPQCGAWNRASLPRCMKCGAELPQEASARPNWQQRLNTGDRPREYQRVNEDGELNTAPDERDVLADEMVELKKRKARGTLQQRRLRQESAQRGAAPSGMTIRTHTSVDTFWNIEDDPRTTVRMHGAPAPRRSDRPKDDADASNSSGTRVTWEDSQHNEPLWMDQPSYDSHYMLPVNPDFTGKLPSRMRFTRRIIYALLIFLMVSICGLCVFFGVHYFMGRQAQVAEQNRPIVTASIKDELAAHTILIPGEDGQQIYIRELHTSYIVTDGFATVEVADHIWYDEIEDFVADTLDVTLTPFIKTSSGQQKPMDLITYQIDVPQSTITLNTPDNLRADVVTSMYSIQFVVRPGSTVYMNDRDISDTVDSQTGLCTYNATVQPIGENIFTIRVRSQYCRENSVTLVLYREPQEIPLDLAAETYTYTTLQKLQISVTTLPGATVDVLSPHSDLDITNLNSTGEFTFYATFDHIGDNVITITSSYPGKKTSQIDYTIYYVPNIDVYSRSAWPLNRQAEYSELVSNITYRTEHNQVYVVMAKLDHLISTKPQIGVFYAGDDGVSQPVVIQNYSRTNTEWEVGSYYRIYGDAQGTYDGMPMLNGRYTYLY